MNTLLMGIKVIRSFSRSLHWKKNKNSLKSYLIARSACDGYQTAMIWLMSKLYADQMDCEYVEDKSMLIHCSISLVMLSCLITTHPDLLFIPRSLAEQYYYSLELSHKVNLDLDQAAVEGQGRKSKSRSNSNNCVFTGCCHLPCLESRSKLEVKIKSQVQGQRSRLNVMVNIHGSACSVQQR